MEAKNIILLNMRGTPIGSHVGIVLARPQDYLQSTGDTEIWGAKAGNIYLNFSIALNLPQQMGCKKPNQTTDVVI